MIEQIRPFIFQVLWMLQVLSHCFLFL